MKKTQLLEILKPLELNDESKNHIDLLLFDLLDEEDVPKEKVQEIVELLDLEIELDSIDMQSTDDIIVSFQKALGDLDTNLEEASLDLNLKNDSFEQKTEKIDNDIEDIQSSLDSNTQAE